MAKNIILKEPEFLGDCKKVQKIFADRGYDITIAQASVLWEKYSAEMLSGWLCLVASDDQIFESVKRYWREANED